MLAQFGIAFYTLFDEPNSVMQDLPDDAAEPMGDGPNGRLIAQSRQQTPRANADLISLTITLSRTSANGSVHDHNSV